AGARRSISTAVIRNPQQQQACKSTLAASLGSVRKAASRNSHSADQVCAEWVRIALPRWPAHGRRLARQLQPGACLGERAASGVKLLQVLVEKVADIQVLAVRAGGDALRQAAERCARRHRQLAVGAD